MLSSACSVEQCTIPGWVKFSAEPNVVVDSLVSRVSSARQATRIEFCCLFGPKPLGELAQAGKRCLKAAPQFVDAKIGDYRLKPTSPCRKRASDGGDIGCRFTPEMLEMLKLAHELRKKGIIKF